MNIYRSIIYRYSRYFRQMRCGVFLSIVTSSAVPSAVAGEVLNIEGGTITGNREQPKVLYIIPWQQPQSSTNLSSSLVTQASSALRPIERGQLLREVDNYNRIKDHNPFSTQLNSQSLNSQPKQL